MTVSKERQNAMTRREYRIKLKHLLNIGHRLDEAGLYRAAIESRHKAQILLQAYKRNFLVKSVKPH